MITVAVLVGITIAGGLLLAFPVQMSVRGGLMIHYLQALGYWDRTVLGPSRSPRHPAGAIVATTSAVAEGRLALAAVVLYVLVVTVPYVVWSKKELVPAR